MSSASLQLLREALPDLRPSITTLHRSLEPRRSGGGGGLGGGVRVGTEGRPDPRLDLTAPMGRTDVHVERLEAELQRAEEALEAERKSGERLRKEKQEVEERVAHLSRQVGGA